MADTKVICLSCGVFKLEIEALIRQGKLDCDLITLDSMLHMKPERLEEAMESALAEHLGSNRLLLYGDCHPRMREMRKLEDTAKVEGLNCCEIFLGKEMYRSLQKTQAFIFLPEWTHRWLEIFTCELGFDKPEIAREFMKESRKRLVYIDTGVIPVPDRTLEEISGFFDMPVEVLHISLDTFLQGIDDALQKFRGNRS